MKSMLSFLCLASCLLTAPVIARESGDESVPVNMPAVAEAAPPVHERPPGPQSIDMHEVSKNFGTAAILLLIVAYLVSRMKKKAPPKE